MPYGLAPRGGPVEITPPLTAHGAGGRGLWGKQPWLICRALAIAEMQNRAASPGSRDAVPGKAARPAWHPRWDLSPKHCWQSRACEVSSMRVMLSLSCV